MSVHATHRQCAEHAQGTRIVVEENGRRFELINDLQHPAWTVKVDECAITAGERCDYLIELGDPGQIAVYVELKGKDIEKAVAQISATIKQFAAHHASGKRVCVIVCRSVPPAITTQMQTIKKRFHNEFNINLHLKTGQFSTATSKL